jgi:cysteine synthase A
MTVVMMPDEGYRYQDSVYDDDWMRANGHADLTIPQEPVLVDHPDQPAGAWTRFDWVRRSFDDVMHTVGQPVRSAG